MNHNTEPRQKILLAESTEENRDRLTHILQQEYDIVTAKDGVEAIELLQQQKTEISLVLLGVKMSRMGGLDVLFYMNRYKWIEYIPVILISHEESVANVDLAYELGVADYVRVPFAPSELRHRIARAIQLAEKQQNLMHTVANQIHDKETSEQMMVSILSRIVEFRNGESGAHVQRIKVITEILLQAIAEKTDRYRLTASDINQIAVASSLHDIGKIAVPRKILNKPGRYTAEEFAVMKQHAMEGAKILDTLPENLRKQPLVKTAYDICRWHHERYDGGGYPDGLKGDEIPISAQVVALADVYDALISERCYKESYSHDTAVRMILEGQCGAFNPLLLECFKEHQVLLKQEMEGKLNHQQNTGKQEMDYLSEQMEEQGANVPDQLMMQIRNAAQQFQFFFSTYPEPAFRYTVYPAIMVWNEAGIRRLGVRETMLEPLLDRKFVSAVLEDDLKRLNNRLKQATPQLPKVKENLRLKIRGELRTYCCEICTLWGEGDMKQFTGLVGRLVDAPEERLRLKSDVNITLINKNGRLPDMYSCTMTMKEAKRLLEQLKEMFTLVRMVDQSVGYQIVLDDDQHLKQSDYHCYSVWGRNARCENCISARCICNKSREDKFEFLNNEIYYVIAEYVEIDGKPYVLEIANRITEDTSLAGYGKNLVVDAISAHNARLFNDPLTGVYNRRYYEEQISGLPKVDALLMIDVDQFKEINDSYGHQAGDAALKQVAKAIKDSVYDSDMVVRYGGDEFIVVFRNIAKHVFKRKMKDIREGIAALPVEDVPDLQVSASVGGAYGPEGVSELLHKADEHMYRTKWERCS